MLFFHLLSIKDYEDLRLKIVTNVEEGGKLKLKPYVDSANYPTIGLGMKLSDPVSGEQALGVILGNRDIRTLSPKGVQNEQAYRIGINTIITSTSYPFGKEGDQMLQDDLDAIMETRAADPLITYPDKRSIFAFNNEQEIIDIFDTLVPVYERRINNRIMNVPNSTERAVLFSLAYNNAALIGNGLVSAIVAGNRAEAWYEIRYASNGDKLPGMAKIRYYESQLFDLYNNTAFITEIEAKQIGQMMAKHKTKIENPLT